jgi:uncharacterized pyridoxal phosphate-containing UPF0001 family protein
MQATISENLSDILTQISTAAKNVDRSKDTVSLIAVSKKQSPELMNE